MNYFKKKVAAGLEAWRKTSWPAGEMLPAYAFLALCFSAIVVIGIADAIVKKSES